MLDKLKSLFIVQENDDKPEKKADDNTPQSSSEKTKTAKADEKPASGSTTHSSSTSANPEVKGTLNDKIMDKLLGVIASNNLDGFDYIEFKNSIKALDKLQMDEKTKFRSAFATAQTIGVTVPKLLDSIDYYQKILAKENSQFATALNNQVAAKVGNKKAEIQEYAKMIADKKAQIKKLTDDIAKHQKHMDELQSKIGKDTLAIEQTRKDFDTTYYKLMYQIKEDTKKIQEYLQ